MIFLLTNSKIIIKKLWNSGKELPRISGFCRKFLHGNVFDDHLKESFQISIKTLQRAQMQQSQEGTYPAEEFWFAGRFYVQHELLYIFIVRQKCFPINMPRYIQRSKWGHYNATNSVLNPWFSIRALRNFCRKPISLWRQESSHISHLFQRIC